MTLRWGWYVSVNGGHRSRGRWRSPSGISAIAGVAGVVVAVVALVLGIGGNSADSGDSGGTGSEPTQQHTYLFVYGTTMPGQRLHRGRRG